MDLAPTIYRIRNVLAALFGVLGGLMMVDLSGETLIRTFGPWSFWELSLREQKLLALSIPNWLWIIAKFALTIALLFIGGWMLALNENADWERLCRDSGK